MRGVGNHTPPKEMLSRMPDNTNEYMKGQIQFWAQESNGPVINYETAREIAAWWQQGINSFAQFASTGTITEYFLDEIAHEVADLSAVVDTRRHADQTVAERLDMLAALFALFAYVKATSQK